MTKADKEGQRKAPILRFKGFTDAWEQRKLQNQVQFFSGLTYSPNDVKSVGTFVIRSSNIKDNTLVPADNVYVNPDIANSEPVKKDDVIMVVRNGSKSLIGKHALVTRKINNTVIGAFMTGIRSSTPYFLDALLDTVNFKKEIYKNLGATINQITVGNLRKMTFKVPNESEKFKIGNLFKKLNYLLALYERKIKLFDDMIAYLKQQLFYKQSSLFFPQSYWKDIAFSKLYIKRKDKNIDVSYDQSKMISVANMKYSDRELNSSREYLKTYYITHFGDIIYEGNRSGNFKYGRFVQNDIGDGIVSHVFTVYKPIDDLDMNFMDNFINYEPIMSRVLLYATTDTLMMHTLHDNELMKQKLNLPDKETQIKIGRILSLVSTIKNRFSERKEFLIKIKRTLLNTMFI